MEDEAVVVAVKQTAVLEQSWVLWVAYHVPHGDLAQRVHAEAQRLLKESANGGDADAQALVAFFRLYRDSEEGRVPFRQWPEGVKGHFIVRLPPPGHVVA